MNKTYSRINWENEPSIVTPINEVNLNRMDSALNEIDNRVVTFDTTKANQTDLLQSVNNVTYDQTTGKFTFSFHNGTIVVADLNIEKIPVSFSMDANGIITMETADGTKFTADVSSLIKTYTFSDSSDIDFIVTTDASGNKTVEALIVDGSITANKLQPNYLADITVQAGIATNSANDSKADALVSEGFAKGTQNGVPVGPTSPYYHNNAEYFKDQANVQSLVALTDVDINQVQDEEVLTYNATSNKWENRKASGGVLPQLIITSEPGSNVYVTDGVLTFYPVEVSGTWITDVPTYGEWIVHSINALGDAVVTLNVDMVKQYKVNASHFNATINVTFPEGAICSCKLGTEEYTATTSPYSFTVHQSGLWEVKAIKDDEPVSKTVNITSDGQLVNVKLELPSITVVLLDEMIGDTVELTKGTKIKSWISDSNTRSFAVDKGEWEVSVEHEGKKISKNVNVLEIKDYVLEITLGFNFNEWLTLGGITQSYSSIEEVLADEKTVRQLMTKHASVDYMVEALAEDTELKTTLLASDNALKWIGLFDYAYDNMPSDFIADWLASDKWEYALKDKVPTMTSASAPYGNVTTNNEHANNPAWKVFDGNSTTTWTDSSSSATHTNLLLTYRFTNPINVKKFDLVFLNESENPEREATVTFKIEGSNNGTSDWQELYSGRTEHSFIPIRENTVLDGYYHYIRLNIVNQTFKSALLGGRISKLQFYGRSLNVSVPKMDSNTSPWGEAIGTYATGYDLFKAFDGNDSSTYWFSNSTNNVWIGYKFEKEVAISRIDFIPMTIDAKATSRQPKTFRIQYSNTGADNDWTTLETLSNTDSTANRKSFAISERFKAKYWRMFVDEVFSGEKNGGVNTLQFYGLDYSEREERTYIYDRGVELVPLTKTSTSVLADIDRGTKTLLRAEVGNKATNTDKIVRGSGNSTFSNGTNPYNWYLDISNLNGTLSTGFSQVANTSDIACWLE